LITNQPAGLSTEPDAMFASWETLESGRLSLAPRSPDDPDGIELVGTPDLVVEVVSTSSHRKDTITLRAAYARASIPEYWLVDARGTALRFEIFALSEAGFYTAATAPNLPQVSHVLGRSFQLQRERNRLGRWSYFLKTQP
jgi:Uma2 family endonuclease